MRSPHRFGSILSLAVVAVASGGAADGVPNGWFEWPEVEAQAGSALDTSALNPQPAGALGRVIVRDGHFATTNGGRIRFWDTGDCGLMARVACLPCRPREVAPQRCRRNGAMAG